ncbi:MAG: spore cortex biosynthesis protein YabQ [Clostridia bacterium]|nr:spore cortex biosynthesis protein YabQ [Clostridia bacterium]
MITNQAYLFLIFTLNGFLIGVFFDFFRILRKSFKTSNLVTYIEDIIFWILTGFLLLYSIFTFNNGQIRIFMFLGIAIGIVLYLLILSHHFINITVYIISIFKNVTKNIINLLKKIVKKGGF